MNKQDSKYQYTASLMDEAFLFLPEQKDYDAIIGKWLEDNCRDDIDLIIDLIMKHTMAYGRDEQ